jgi:hypothetical protein
MDLDREMRIASSKLWLEFKENPYYLDIVDDIKERREGLISDLIRGEDPTINTDGELRKRIQELDWILMIVEGFIMECVSAEKDRQTQTISDDKETSDEEPE